MNQTRDKWNVLVMAAGRGPTDPLAKAFNVSHKCALEVGGVAMLKRVVDTLLTHASVGDIFVSIDDAEIAEKVLAPLPDSVHFINSKQSAASSASVALEEEKVKYPVLLTTADHALLDHMMLDHFFKTAETTDADLCVGLASDKTILAQYPEAKRTFLKFGKDKVSGCNLFALKTSNAKKAIDFWQHVEKNRKNPFALARAFGVTALLAYLTGLTSLRHAFQLASRKIGIKAEPVLMPFANAAIDVDKPEDKDLVEEILARR